MNCNERENFWMQEFEGGVDEIETEILAFCEDHNVTVDQVQTVRRRKNGDSICHVTFYRPDAEEKKESEPATSNVFIQHNPGFYETPSTGTWTATTASNVPGSTAKPLYICKTCSANVDATPRTFTTDFGAVTHARNPGHVVVNIDADLYRYHCGSRACFFVTNHRENMMQHAREAAHRGPGWGWHDVTPVRIKDANLKCDNCEFVINDWMVMRRHADRFNHTFTDTAAPSVYRRYECLDCDPRPKWNFGEGAFFHARNYFHRVLDNNVKRLI